MQDLSGLLIDKTRSNNEVNLALEAHKSLTIAHENMRALRSPPGICHKTPCCPPEPLHKQNHMQKAKKDHPTRI